KPIPPSPPARVVPGGTCRWPKPRSANRCARRAPVMSRRRHAATSADPFNSAQSPNRGSTTMTVKLGINPIGWTNDCLHWLGDFIPLEQCLAEARQAGFSGVELGRKFPRQAGKLGPILKKHGLSLVSGWYSAELLRRD